MSVAEFLRTSIIGWAIGEVEQRLRNGALRASGTTKFEELDLGEAELPEVEHLVLQKTCCPFSKLDPRVQKRGWFIRYWRAMMVDRTVRGVVMSPPCQP
jgi:hypothetical protein